MPKNAMPRYAEMTSARNNNHATGIMAVIRRNAPQTEIGRHVYVKVTQADLPALRTLVSYLESQAGKER